VSDPWDRYSRGGSETVIKAHGLEFVVTTATAAAYCEPDGQAKFSYDEMGLLNRAVDGEKLPAEISKALHSVKRILGGEIIDAKSFAR
jgi:hypothetical protein